MTFRYLFIEDKLYGCSSNKLNSSTSESNNQKEKDSDKEGIININ